METLLSICIPTYNRAPYLKEMLTRLIDQIKELPCQDIIELFISDNCSTDNTFSIVKEFEITAPYLKYYKNETNLGMDGNFINCFNKAKGKFVWLLGDDDYLLPGKLKVILDILKRKDYGLIHLNTRKDLDARDGEYDDSNEFLSKVSFWSTFISGNIVNSMYVNLIDFEKYRGTFLTILPPYLLAAKNSKYNYFCKDFFLDISHNYSRNGGYNYIQVFCNNYLSIWKDYCVKDKNDIKWYEKEKKNLFLGHLKSGIYNLLIYKKNRDQFLTKNSWKVLYRHYKTRPYFYTSLAKMYARYLLNTLKK